MAFDKDVSNKLLDAANDGAKSLKALFFWYVGALTYAVISVADVSDEQLLKEMPLKLPVISVDIPLLEYFAFLPLVVVIVHLELLVQFALLSNKINDFNRSLRHASRAEAEDFRLRLENFMLSHLLAGDHRAILRCLLFVLMYASLVALPLFALLLIQTQFLAYHSEPMMWWHRILILLDALALMYFWPNMFHREDMTAGAWTWLMLSRIMPQALALLILLGGLYVALASVNFPLSKIAGALGLFLTAFILVSVSGQALLSLGGAGQAPARWRRLTRFGEAFGHHFVRVSVLAVIGCAIIMGIVALRRYAKESAPAEFVVPVLVILLVFFGGWAVVSSSGKPQGPLRLWYDRLTLWAGRKYTVSKRRDAPALAAFGAQCTIVLALSWFVLSIPSGSELRAQFGFLCEVAREQGAFGPTAQAAMREPSNAIHEVPVWYRLLIPVVPTTVGDHITAGEGYIRPTAADDYVDLCVEGLSYGLPGDATMKYTFESESEGVPGEFAVGDAPVSALLLSALNKHRVLILNEKVLVDQALTPEFAQLLRDEDEKAWRTAAPIDLRDRNLTGIQLDDALLPRVLLDGARMDMASLQRTNLQGASLRGTILWGSDLWEAKLEGAKLENAQLQGADLDSAILRSASLSGAQLQGVMLDNAKLTGAQLDGAQIQGASLDLADLQNASLVGAGLQGASLWNTKMQRALLWETNVRGADMNGANLDYAIVAVLEGELDSLDDAELMVDNAEFGQRYSRYLTTYRQRLATSDATAWPYDIERIPCLVADDRLVGAVSCTYEISEEDKVPQFWSSFAEPEAAAMCEGPVDGKTEPLQHVPHLRAAIAIFSRSPDHIAGRMGAMIAEGLTPILTGEACQQRWSRRLLDDAVKLLEDRTETESVMAELAFHRAWLASVVEAEQRAQAETKPSQ